MDDSWKNARAGTLNDAMQRFLSSLGNQGEMVLEMMAMDCSPLAGELAEYAKMRTDQLARVSKADFILEVNYDEDFDAMIAAGNYGSHNGYITRSYFPITGKGTAKFEAKLIDLNGNLCSSDVKHRIMRTDTERPWEPCKIEHLLAFGKQFPNEQRKYPIVALGTCVEVDGEPKVPFLYSVDSKRTLLLERWNVDWLGNCRFLAVRKISGS